MNQKNNTNVELSVVVPVYNRAELIKPLIKSLNEQTLEPERFEVIFVDDASTDNTKETIFKNCQLNFRYLQRPIQSGGAALPRNDGIKAAKGDYIFFVDSDDFLADENVLKDVLGYAFQNDLDVLYVKMLSCLTGEIICRCFGGNNNTNSADIFKDALILYGGPVKLFKRSFLLKNNLFFLNTTMGEDRYLSYNAIALSNKIGLLRDRCYYNVVEHLEGHLGKISDESEILREFLIFSSTLNFCCLIDNANKKNKYYNSLLFRFIKGEPVHDLNNEISRKILSLFESYYYLFDPALIYKDKIDQISYIIGEWKNVSFVFKLKRLKWKMQEIWRSQYFKTLIFNSGFRNALLENGFKFFTYAKSVRERVFCLDGDCNKISTKNPKNIIDEHIVEVEKKDNKIALKYKNKYICNIKDSGEFDFVSSPVYFNLIKEQKCNCFYIQQDNMFFNILANGNIKLTSEKLGFGQVKFYYFFGFSKLVKS